jgi:hypothetical protein
MAGRCLFTQRPTQAAAGTTSDKCMCPTRQATQQTWDLALPPRHLSQWGLAADLPQIGAQACRRPAVRVEPCFEPHERETVRTDGSGRTGYR